VKLLIALVAILLAGGLWWLLAGSASDDSPSGSGPSAEELSPELRYLTRGTEVVTLWVKTPDGKVPPGAELGLRYKGKTHWLYADDHGRRLFTGAPIGTLEAVARAPGYEETVEKVTIEAGFSGDRVLVIRAKQ
jgi:hypothetical protein